MLSQIFIERAFAGLLWLTRTDAICIGVLIALFSSTRAYSTWAPTFLRIRPIAWALLVILCGIIASVDAPKAHFVSASIGLVAVLSGILIWSASYDTGYAVPASGFRRFLIYFGSRSYGLYVVHYAASFFIAKMAMVINPDDPKGYFVLLEAPLAIAFAETNFWLIEMPLRKYGAAVAARLAKRLSSPDEIAPRAILQPSLPSSQCPANR